MKSKRGIRGVLALAASILILSTAGCGMTERIQDMAGRLFGGEEGQETEGETAAAEESGQEGTEENKDGGPSADGETIDGDSPLTREEFIQLLADGFGYDTSKAGRPVILDLPENSESYPAAAAALDHGVWDMESGCFFPDILIDRGTAVLWVMNGLGLSAEAENPFTDMADEEQARAVSIAVKKGFISGYEDNTFRPEEEMTGSEAQDLIGKAIQYRIDRQQLRENASNTIELQEGVVYALSDGQVNVPTEIDPDAMEVVFGNADDTLRAMVPGNILFMGNCQGFPDGFLAKAESVSLEGTSVRMKVSQPGLAEVIKKVDISAVFYADENSYLRGGDLAPIEGAAQESAGSQESEASQENGVSQESKASQESEDSQESKADQESSAGPVFEHDFDAEGHYEDDAYWDWDGVHWNIYTGATEKGTIRFATAGAEKKEGFYATLDMGLEAAIDLQIEAENLEFTTFSLYTSVDTDVTGVAGYKDNGQAEARFDMPDCVIPVSGPVSITIKPWLVMEAQGQFQVEANVQLTNNLAFAFENGETETINTTSVNPAFTASAQGSIEAGPLVEVEVGLAGTPFFDGLVVVEGEAEMGFGVNGRTQVEQRLEVTDTSVTYSGNQNTPDENGNLHVCYLCIQGQFYAYSDAKIGIGEEIQEQIRKVFKDANMTFDPEQEKKTLGYWHYSAGDGYGPEFALEMCPHIAYPITMTALEKGTGRLLAGVGTDVAGRGDKAQKKESLSTGGNGKALFYLENGVYDLFASKKDYKPDPYQAQLVVNGKKVDFQIELERGTDEPLIIRSSGMAEYKGQVYITKINDNIEAYQYVSGTSGETKNLTYVDAGEMEFPEDGYVCGMAFYRDKLYLACKSPGTSSYDSAIYVCEPDGSGLTMLAEGPWSESGHTVVCTGFIIVDGCLYYDMGRLVIDLETGERREADGSMEEIYSRGYNGYGNKSIYVGSDYYYIDENGIYVNLGGKTQTVASLSLKFEEIIAVTEDSVFFESCTSDGRAYYLYRLDLAAGTVDEIDGHMAAGGGGYFNW